MIDLTDFLNVVASAEDWAGFGADGREPEEPMKRDRRAGRALSPGQGRLRQSGLRPSSVLRDLLEREFPATSGQFRLPL